MHACMHLKHTQSAVCVLLLRFYKNRPTTTTTKTSPACLNLRNGPLETGREKRAPFLGFRSRFPNSGPVSGGSGPVSGGSGPVSDGAPFLYFLSPFLLLLAPSPFLAQPTRRPKAGVKQNPRRSRADSCAKMRRRAPERRPRQSFLCCLADAHSGQVVLGRRRDKHSTVVDVLSDTPLPSQLPSWLPLLSNDPRRKA